MVPKGRPNPELADERDGWRDDEGEESVKGVKDARESRGMLERKREKSVKICYLYR